MRRITKQLCFRYHQVHAVLIHDKIFEHAVSLAFNNRHYFVFLFARV